MFLGLWFIIGGALFAAAAAIGRDVAARVGVTIGVVLAAIQAVPVLAS